MKLLIKGTLVDRGRAGSLDNCLEDLPSLVGRRISLGNPDYALILDRVEERLVAFRFIRFDDANILTLRIGQSYEFQTEGNAFEYRIRFALEE